MQTQDSGRNAIEFGKKIAAIVAARLGVAWDPAASSNEISIDGKRAVIKSASYKTLYVGVTKTMLPRLDRAYAALEDSDGNFALHLLNREFLDKFKTVPGGVSQQTQWFFSRSDIRKNGKHLENFSLPKKRFWVTTHWPHRTDIGADDRHEGVHLPNGRHLDGQKIAPGDLVAIYESRTGRDLIIENVSGRPRTLTSHVGREGVVDLVEVASELYTDPESEPEKYQDGTSIWWRWHADTKPYLSSGFVPQVELNGILGYKPGYNLRGFGDDHSGLKEVDVKCFADILAAFKRNRGNSEAGKLLAKAKSFPRVGGGFGGGESEEHRRLKDAIAANPSGILKEPGLKLIKKEYSFDSGDKADIMLEDAHGRIIGLEVEVGVDLRNLAGVLQAIKYRFMGALTEGVKFQDSRSMLVAYTISQEIRTLCEKYEISCFEIKESDLG